MTARDQATRVRHVILALACGISFVLYLHRYTWGFIKPDLQKEFGWSTDTLGWLDSAFVATYGIGQIPSGMLCDWFGARALLGASIAGWSLAMGAVALATGVVSMTVARLAFGATQAACYPVLNKVSKNWFPIVMRTTAQGWIATLFGRGGGAMSYFVVGTVLLGWMQLSWRTALGAMTLVGLVVAGLFVWLFRNTPREHPWANQAEADLVVGDDPEAAFATRTRLRWLDVARSANMWVFFFRGFMINLADVLFIYWVPFYLLTEKGVDVKSAGWMAALPLAGGALGGAVSGSLQSRLISRVGRRWARSLVGFTGMMLAGVFMWVSLAFDEAAIIVSVFFVVKFFSDWGQPAEWGTVSDVAGRNAATLFASVNTVGAVAAFIAGPATGWILHYFSDGPEVTSAGWTALFVIISLEYAAGAVAWLLVDCTKTLDGEGRSPRGRGG